MTVVDTLLVSWRDRVLYLCLLQLESSRIRLSAVSREKKLNEDKVVQLTGELDRKVSRGQYKCESMWLNVSHGALSPSGHTKQRSPANMA